MVPMQLFKSGNEFSARAFATNFNREELKSCYLWSFKNVKNICHLVNTLYEDNQFENLKDYLLFL